MKVLGVSAFYHDSAAALLIDGEIIAASQEERFTRKKHDSRFPYQSIEAALKAGGIQARDLDGVVFYDKPLVKFDRILETYFAFAPRGIVSFVRSLPLWLKDKLFQKRMILEALARLDDSVDWRSKLNFSEHHLSHAASAFFPSPFEEAAVLTMDGVGEWTTTSLAYGKGNELKVLKEIQFPHSLGLLYSAFTTYCGFKVNSGEYKLMGLAPYGVPRYAELIRKHLIETREDGSFWLNLDYFDYCTGLSMTNRKFWDLFGGKPRHADKAPLEQKHMDLAASIQLITEEVVMKLAAAALKECGTKNLCLAGGVALNCVANGKLIQNGVTKNLWIQPAAGDAGGALGAALAYVHLNKGLPRKARTPGRDEMRGSYLGPEFSQSEIEAALTAAGAKFEVLSEQELLKQAAADLAKEKALGWFQGRMEFGPRALGGRSILGDPRSSEMQSVLNLKVKFRESFRPFAPSVKAEKVGEWFELDQASPYMLLVAPVKNEIRKPMSAEQEALFGIEKLKVPRSQIPAVTHVDYSARVQTVSREVNALYYGLLDEFEQQTGCPVLVNTSFNVRGEPIVGSPHDAFRCFMGTHIERLAVGRCYLKKEDQPAHLAENYKDLFELD